MACPGKLPGGLLGADWTKRLKTGWHWVDVCWRDEKGHGIAWGLDLPLSAFEGRQMAKVWSKFFLKRHFGGQNKLLNLASQTVNYGTPNGPIIAHVLTERYNKWFYLIIFAFNDLKNTWSDTSLRARTISLIILCQNASSYILRIYFSGSKISTCLRNNETWYNEKNQFRA